MCGTLCGVEKGSSALRISRSRFTQRPHPRLVTPRAHRVRSGEANRLRNHTIVHLRRKLWDKDRSFGCLWIRVSRSGNCVEGKRGASLPVRRDTWRGLRVSAGTKRRAVECGSTQNLLRFYSYRSTHNITWSWNIEHCARTCALFPALRAQHSKLCAHLCATFNTARCYVYHSTQRAWQLATLTRHIQHCPCSLREVLPRYEKSPQPSVLRAVV